MRNWLTYVGLAGVAVVFLWIGALQLRVSIADQLIKELEAEKAVLSLQVAQTQRAMRLEADRATIWRQRSETLEKQIETILEGTIPDADLDPALIDLLNGLRPRN